MTKFTIYPAIDLRQGKVVRLKQGDPNRSTVFSQSPTKTAQCWLEQGAKWLHVINLDGAFGDGSESNLMSLKEMLNIVDDTASIQFGGGLRSLESINQILSLGVARVILGTIAVKAPNLVIEALNKFGPEKIVLGIDSKDNQVKVGGWLMKTGMTPNELADKYIQSGLRTIIFTNIKHDGMQNGVDIHSAQSLAADTQLEVIASGGVGTLEDVMQVKAAGLSGVVIGKALYENNFSLSEAMTC